MVSIPELGISPGRENGNPLQYCLEYFMDRGAWWPSVHGVIKSQMWLTTHTHTHTHTHVIEFQINQQKSNLNHQNREANSHRKRSPQHCQKFIRFLSAFSKIAYTILPVWQLSGERKILTLSLDTISKLTPIPGDCKHYCSPPVRVESYRNELKFISKWSSDSMNP